MEGIESNNSNTTTNNNSNQNGDVSTQQTQNSNNTNNSIISNNENNGNGNGNENSTSVEENKASIMTQGENAMLKDLEQRVSKWEARLEANEWDVESWVSIFTEAQAKPIYLSRPYFERFFKQFPTAVRSILFYYHCY